MKPIAGRQIARIIVLSFLFLILLFIIDGCKEDSSSSPTLDTTFPSVAGQWGGIVEQPGIIYDVTWSIVQSLNKLSGTSLWITRPTGLETKCWFEGTIDMNRQLALLETKYEAVNWSGSGWALCSYTGRLNSKGDSLYLAWKVLGGGTGDFVLTKK